MSTEIRTPTEEDRQGVGDVMAVSMNFGPSWMQRRAHLLPLEDMRCVVEGGRVVATAGGRAFTQWFGGREVDMLGVWGVATLPEHRRSGNARRLVGELLREARKRGTPLSALYPAVLRPYRGMGYELAGWYVTHEVRLDDLPRGASGPLVVEEYDAERDFDAVRSCYRRTMAEHNGPIDAEDEWWTTRRLGHVEPEDLHRVVVARGRNGIEAYASFIQEKIDGTFDVSFRIACKHLIASTIEGYATLIEYFRGFGGLGQSLRFEGAPADPLGMLLEEQRVNIVWAFRWMLRLLDVQAALEQRGYPPVDGEVTIAVEDALFPENRGPWRIAVTDGTVKVMRAEGSHATVVPIGALSSMYSGFLSPHDAVRLGLLRADDPAVAVLARLFAGPAPFMLDFF